MSIREFCKKLFTKENILTFPNALSVVRLCLIPVIYCLYCSQGQYTTAAAVVVLSGMTDLLDGKIARKLHMTSDLGKILDPLADKLTQMVMMVCLLDRYPWVGWLIGFFVAKETAQTVCVGLRVKNSGEVHSSNYFGKISTMVIYAVMILLFVFPEISENAAKLLCLTCGGFLLAALTAYARKNPIQKKGSTSRK